MKKLFLATTALVALIAVPAGAADMAVKAPYIPPPPSCAQFGGFYVGGNVGWGYGDHTFRSLDTIGGRFEDRTLGPIEVSRSVNGWEAGIQGGYNWQSHCTLFGVEADYQWTNIDHDFTRTGRLGNLTVAGSVNLQGFGTVRARTGIIVDNVLLYLTGGLAYANTERSVELIWNPNPALNQGPFTDEKTRWGWTMGFGTEWKFASNWSFKSEVLYARFETDESSRTCGVNLCGGAAPTTVRFEHDSSAWVSRIGVNYYFGGGLGKGPVSARY
jgi:outer membrane immunogenic protein